MEMARLTAAELIKILDSFPKAETNIVEITVDVKRRDEFEDEPDIKLLGWDGQAQTKS